MYLHNLASQLNHLVNKQLQTAVAADLTATAFTCVLIQIVNGPEILNKFVGESESNIRKLFEDAEEEQKRVRNSLILFCFISSPCFVFYFSLRNLTVVCSDPTFHRSCSNKDEA